MRSPAVFGVLALVAACSGVGVPTGPRDAGIAPVTAETAAPTTVARDGATPSPTPSADGGTTGEARSTAAPARPAGSGRATPTPTAPASAAPLAGGPLDDAMASYMRVNGLPGGTLAVVRDGALVYARGYGTADGSAAPAPRSSFRIASVSKMFTAAAIRRLVADGRLTLSTPVYGLLGIAPYGGAHDARLESVTVQELIDHRGGWDSSISGDPMFESRQIASALGVASPPSAGDTIRYVFGKPLDYAPGTKSVYSNFGYVVLGAVVEKVTGASYDAYVRSLLRGAGVSRTVLGTSLGTAPGEVRYFMPPAAGTAASVFDEDPGAVPWPYGGFALEPMAANGGWRSDVIDLARFGAALDERSGSGIPRPESDPVPTRAGYTYTYRWFGSLPGTFAELTRSWDGAHYLVHVALFNERTGNATADDAIAQSLDAAVARTTSWPADLFPLYP